MLWKYFFINNISKKNFDNENFIEPFIVLGNFWVTRIFNLLWRKLMMVSVWWIFFFSHYRQMNAASLLWVDLVLGHYVPIFQFLRLCVEYGAQCLALWCWQNSSNNMHVDRKQHRDRQMDKIYLNYIFICLLLVRKLLKHFFWLH